MTVVSAVTDHDALSMTLVAEFDASISQVWQLWADPRQLEQWWGPPSHPTTFTSHDLTPGGMATFVMVGPEDDRHHGWWRILSVTPPTSLEFIDGFADADGNPLEDMPSPTAKVTLSAHNGGTRMEVCTRYETHDGFEKMVSLGMEDGWRLCVGQMDALLV